MKFKLFSVILQLLLICCLVLQTQNCYAYWKSEYMIAGDELDGNCIDRKHLANNNLPKTTLKYDTLYRLDYVCTNSRLNIPIYSEADLRISFAHILDVYQIIVERGTRCLVEDFKGFKYSSNKITKIVACCIIEAIKDYNFWLMSQNNKLQNIFRREKCVANVPGYLEINVSVLLGKMLENNTLPLYFKSRNNSNLILVYIE